MDREKVLREALRVIRQRCVGRRYANVKGLACIDAIAAAALAETEVCKRCGEPRNYISHKPATECEGCRMPAEHHTYEGGL